MNTENALTPKKNTLSLYWKCQLSGWGLVSIYWAYTVYTRDNYGFFYTLLNYTLDASVGIFLTHMYRRFAIRAGWSNLPIKKLLLTSITGLIMNYALIIIKKCYPTQLLLLIIMPLI